MILAQTTTSTSLTDIYESPYEGTSIVWFVVASRSASSGLLRVAIAPNGLATEDKNYLVYDKTLPGYDTFAWTETIQLLPQDTIRVSLSVDGSVTVFGTHDR